MKRVKFQKGKQRKFLKEVLSRTNCPNLRSLNQFGFDIPSSTLKNYFNESRFLPKDLFMNLCFISKLDPGSFQIQVLPGNWGQIIGGKRGKKTVFRL